MQALGGRVENEYVVIGTWPVQILPAYTPWVEEAVTHASSQTFEDLKVRVVTANVLSTLVNKFALTQRWETYVRRYS